MHPPGLRVGQGGVKRGVVRMFGKSNGSGVSGRTPANDQVVSGRCYARAPMDPLPFDCRLSPLTFDIASAAGWYSSIAGVLAGFALLAILLPLDHIDDDTDEATTSNAVVVFVSAFFSLLILSFAYAVLAGRSGDGDELAIATFEQLLLGGMFGLSTLLLLLGLQAVLRSYGANRLVFAPARQLIRVMTADPRAGARARAAVLERARSGPLSSASGYGCAGAVRRRRLPVVGLGRPRHRRRRDGRHRPAGPAPRAAPGRSLGRARPRPSSCSAMTVVIVITASVLVPLLPLETLTSPLLEHGALLVAAAGALAVAWATWAGR